MMPLEGGGPEEVQAEFRLATCAVLLELAYADDAFTREEQEYVTDAVRRQFGLDPVEAEQLVQLAEEHRVGGGEIGGFTNLIRDHYSMQQKAALVEMMWGVVRADGTLAPRENQLMKRVCALVELGPGFLAAARERWEGAGPAEIFD
jgi:uncharacterized tellurite resistance protein B-like protein